MLFYGRWIRLFQGVVKFEPKSGKQLKTKSKTKSYTQYFAESLIAEAERDEKIVAIMGGGTGLNLFQKHFPERCFDVGIAEQHAVTFAAGLATEGLKPFCTIYSSFLQRGYDQVAHDVDLQKLPVRFALDRAGLVGADGPTHCGAFDTTFMACLPNMVVMAPSCETELMHMVSTAAAIDDRPSCFRYPRGNGIGSILPPTTKAPLSRFLAERGELSLLDADDRSVPLKDIYKKVAEGKSGCCWESFEVYRHLRSLGYIVGRHGIPWTVKSIKNKPHSVEGTLEIEVIIDQKFEDLNLVNELFNNIRIDEVRPVFDVYPPNSKFRKSSPGNPSFVLCMTSGHPPSKPEIEDLERQCNGIPLKFCHVEYGRVSFFSFNRVELPVLP